MSKLEEEEASDREWRAYFQSPEDWYRDETSIEASGEKATAFTEGEPGYGMVDRMVVMLKAERESAQIEYESIAVGTLEEEKQRR